MKLTDIITENDNQTICPGRVMLVLGCLVFCCLALLNYAKFDGISFGAGYGGLIGGGLTGIWAKSKTDGKP